VVWAWIWIALALLVNGLIFRWLGGFVGAGQAMEPLRRKKQPATRRNPERGCISREAQAQKSSDRTH
jgi:hypothetical protein